MGDLKLGSNGIANAYVGNTGLSAIHKGNEKLWPSSIFTFNIEQHPESYEHRVSPSSNPQTSEYTEDFNAQTAAGLRNTVASQFTFTRSIFLPGNTTFVGGYTHWFPVS